MLIDNTPWEQYDITDSHESWPIWVKREDLCCGNDPLGPSFSKMRGVIAYLEKIGDRPVGVLDTYHSKAGRGVAWLCAQMRIKCFVFFPVYKEELVYGDIDWGRPYSYPPNCTVREHQRMANTMGAYLVPLPAGRSAVLYHQASQLLHEITIGAGCMLPNALKLDETVEATANEVIYHTPSTLVCGTWVVSISSGTIAAGVLSGLYTLHKPMPKVITHMGYSRSEASARVYMLGRAGLRLEHVNLEIIDEGYAYKDKVDNSNIPFPCNEYYDAKAFLWLVDHIHELEQPVVFWNIGN